VNLGSVSMGDYVFIGVWDGTSSAIVGFGGDVDPKIAIDDGPWAFSGWQSHEASKEASWHVFVRSGRTHRSHDCLSRRHESASFAASRGVQ